MSHLKNNLVFSSLTILLVTGGSLGFAQSTHNKVSSQKLEAKNVNQVSNYSGDIDLLAVSQPTTRTTNNGQINSAFINHFNNAVILDSKTGQFSINQKTLPINATKLELTELDKLISQSNVSLKQTILEVPKANVVQDGNSVVIGDSPKTAEEIASDSQATLITIYHEGKTYLHTYWWGTRLGVSRTLARKIGQKGVHSAEAAGALAGVLGLKLPQAAVYCSFISGVSYLIGTALTKTPGGIVFNFTAGMPSGGVWGFEWQ